jgi:hypothetical protein
VAQQGLTKIFKKVKWETEETKNMVKKKQKKKKSRCK